MIKLFGRIGFYTARLLWFLFQCLWIYNICSHINIRWPKDSLGLCFYSTKQRCPIFCIVPCFELVFSVHTYDFIAAIATEMVQKEMCRMFYYINTAYGPFIRASAVQCFICWCLQKLLLAFLVIYLTFLLAFRRPTNMIDFE